MIWDADFDFEDFGYDRPGIVQCCHCTNCGARITYEIPIFTEDDEDGIELDQLQRKES